MREGKPQRAVCVSEDFRSVFPKKSGLNNDDSARLPQLNEVFHLKETVRKSLFYFILTIRGVLRLSRGGVVSDLTW